MRSQFTLKLNSNVQRPVVVLNDFYNITAMLDTGALFPVWTAKEEVLQFLGAKLILPNVKFSGFGGRTEGNLYMLPSITIGTLVYPNMQIVACELDIPYHMVLSATMFSGLIYEIDDCNHTFNVTVPDSESTVRNLVIKDIDGKLHVLCTSSDEDSAEIIIAKQSSIFQ